MSYITPPIKQNLPLALALGKMMIGSRSSTDPLLITRGPIREITTGCLAQSDAGY